MPDFGDIYRARLSTRSPGAPINPGGVVNRVTATPNPVSLSPSAQINDSAGAFHPSAFPNPHPADFGGGGAQVSPPNAPSPTKAQYAGAGNPAKWSTAQVFSGVQSPTSYLQGFKAEVANTNAQFANTPSTPGQFGFTPPGQINAAAVAPSFLQNNYATPQNPATQGPNWWQSIINSVFGSGG